MLDKKKKQKLIDKYKTHKSDTGSPEIQIAILTEEVKELTKHLREHKKDFSSRKGLLSKVSLRHKLLRYLEREDDKRFNKLVKALKIKIAKRERIDFGPEPPMIKAEDKKEEDKKEEDKKEK
ncbi:30S ribosomal protein S15 [Candidatus Parcubacteria bacterium]|jgi:small subunit ribosomal protein S15|nr:30S ribosomal protein S15 [Candidatus Parcubacteria bacterium]MBT7228032.1 30S ribosomal protein S15 [Candidatus Parcubacteria bacterium]